MAGKTNDRFSTHDKWHYQKGKCHYCGEDMVWPEYSTQSDWLRATRDHIIPKSQGGSGYPRNIVLCHDVCNRAKGNTPYDIFRHMVPELIEAGQLPGPKWREISGYTPHIFCANLQDHSGRGPAAAGSSGEQYPRDRGGYAPVVGYEDEEGRIGDLGVAILESWKARRTGGD